MVIFQTPEGNPGYNQFETVGEAVTFVESLRNEQGVQSARMFALEEVKFEFKPYYRVELPALASGSGVQPERTPAAVASPASAAPAPGSGMSTRPESFQPTSPAPVPSFQAAPPAPAVPSFATSSAANGNGGGAVGTLSPPTFGTPAPKTAVTPTPTAPPEAPPTGRRGLFGR